MNQPVAAYRGSEPFVFVCYAHDDADLVYDEMAWLNDQGFHIWYDEGVTAGENWRATIGDALMRADKVLFYVSAASLRSDHCNREVSLALDEGKEVLPVYLEAVDLPADLKVGLNRIHALEWRADGQYRAQLARALGHTGEVDTRNARPSSNSWLRRRARLWHVVLATAIVLASIFGLLWPLLQPPEPDAAPVRRFAIETGATASLVGRFFNPLPAEVAISRDGSRFVYSVETDQGRQLFLRTLDDPVPRELASTSTFSPAFAPDGQSVAVYMAGPDGLRLTTIDVNTGRARPLAPGYPPTGVAWLDDDTIVYTHNNLGVTGEGQWRDKRRGTLWAIDADGGQPRQVSHFDTSRGEVSHLGSAPLPGADHVLFDLRTHSAPAGQRNHVGILDMATEQHRVLIEDARGAQYVSSGHLLFIRDDALWTAPFDLNSLALTGEAVIIETQFADVPGYNNKPVAVADTGSAIIVPPAFATPPVRQPAWVDRNGNITPIAVPPGEYGRPRISPDGELLVLERTISGNVDLWVHDFDRSESVFRLTTHPASDLSPAWAADSRTIYYGSARDSGAALFAVPADGAQPTFSSTR